MVSLSRFAAMIAMTLLATSNAEACTPTYSVVEGDTLWDIAHDQMGSAWNYPEIFEVNRDIVKDPHWIYIGDVLDIPCKTGELGEINWSVMPTPNAFTLLDDAMEVQVVDIRSEEEIKKGTIPGALWMPYADWRGPEKNPGAPRTTEDYETLLGEAGLRLDLPTLIVHAEDTPLSTGGSAYVYWVLKSLGAEELAILRGGFDAWQTSGGEIAATPADPKPYSVDLAFSPNWRASDFDVLKIASGSNPGVLLDARPHEMYNQLDTLGKAIATTIPTARNLPAPPLMKALAAEFDIEDGVDTVIDYYRSREALGQEGDVITFCKSGQLSALNWFYASELASIDNVKLYPESLIGWKQSYGVLAVGEN